ncbi:MAG: diadenylate cyclase CdaA [Oscillibacter sp.]|nr:diadenylate cyclase CdaA [Oscillibacter sp.]
MEVKFAELPAVIGRYLLLIELTDLLDIVIMSFVMYKVFMYVKSTKVASLLKGLLVFFAVLMFSYVFRLNSINFLMSKMVEWGVLALIILFQPELRRLLEEMGSKRFISFFSTQETPVNAVEQAIGQTVVACTEMSQSRTGALIVFEREMRLDDMIRSGTVLDASVTSELFKNIFFVKAPMHDGAVIVRRGRIQGAGCMLPLSKNVNLSRDLGMRHRAGIGMSENSDAVVVIVSEESGSISVAIGGMLKRHLKPETLENLLRNELLPRESDEEDKPKLSFNTLLGMLTSKKNGGGIDEE